MGLSEGADYWCIDHGYGVVALATSERNAFDGMEIMLTTPGCGFLTYEELT